MQAHFERERDLFDQWVSQVLVTRLEDVAPSERVWQRIVQAARAMLVWGMWRKQGNSRAFVTWSAWYEQRRRCMETQLNGLGWGLLYPRMLSYV